MRGWKSVSILIAASVTSQTTQPIHEEANKFEDKAK